MLLRRPLAHALLLGALVLAYYGGLFYAMRFYPSGYDWRRTVISNLANPHDNPLAWRVAADGIALTGVLLAVAGTEACRVLRPLAPKWTLWATIFFVLGGTLLTVSALINPGHYALFGLGKAHAKIAQAAAIALNLGMAMTIPALLRLPPRWPVARAGVLFLAVGPMTLFLLCRMIAIHDSLFPSLAFWEWIASATVFSFLAVVLFIGKIR